MRCRRTYFLDNTLCTAPCWNVIYITQSIIVLDKSKITLMSLMIIDFKPLHSRYPIIKMSLYLNNIKC